MKINLKCFADLADRYDCNYRTPTPVEVTEGSTVASVMSRSGISDDEVRIVFVNGRVSDSGSPLSDGDRVTLVPATGGM